MVTSAFSQTIPVACPKDFLRKVWFICVLFFLIGMVVTGVEINELQSTQLTPFFADDLFTLITVTGFRIEEPIGFRFYKGFNIYFFRQNLIKTKTENIKIYPEVHHNHLTIIILFFFFFYHSGNDAPGKNDYLQFKKSKSVTVC